MTPYQIVQADCLDFLRSLEPGSVDLVFGSPPYMDARTYDDGTLPTGTVTIRDCQAWVDWMVDVTQAAVAACKGLVLWVVAGVQRDLCYWPGCEGLAWEWWKRGNQLWRPCIWWKVDENDGGTGIPGSGGKQWLRNDWEYVLAFKREGWLPWADPLVMGHEPVYGRVGGAMSNRTVDGRRINEAAQAVASNPWGGKFESIGNRATNGERKHKRMDVTAGKDSDGNLKPNVSKPLPKIVNPGNCLVVKARVGGGHMGETDLCHDNEAPFPEDLAAFFVQSFCPPGGLVCDPFSGSGTTCAVSVRHGRRFTGCDLRSSQVELTKRRLSGETPLGLFA